MEFSIKRICLLPGFTLLEIIISLSIVAILASITYPLYTHHIQTAQQRMAKANLLHIASQLEKAKTSTGTYQNAASVIETINDSHYHYRINSINNANYTLSATPNNLSARKNPCNSLTLNATTLTVMEPPGCRE